MFNSPSRPQSLTATRRRWLLLLTLLMCSPGWAAGEPANAPAFSQFTTMYYLHPQPEQVAEAIQALRATGYASQDPSAATTSPFIIWFAEVFIANPQRLNEWRKVIARQKGAEKHLLQEALVLTDRGGLLAVSSPPPNAGYNDWYWAGFFASGKPAYIHRLVEQLRYLDNRQDPVLYGAAGSAEWSLSSNAQQHPRVREILEQERAAADAQTGRIIADLLTRDPSLIQSEVVSTLGQIQASGAQPQD